MISKRCRILVELLIVGLMSASATQAADAKPNIVIILADDLGHADLSLHGSKEVATPSIDSLARNGVRCTNGYVSGPYCSPTRAGLLAGRYQQRFGHEFNPQLLEKGGKGQGLDVKQVTLAQRLKDAGYATAAIGKWHLGEEDQFHPLSRGFGEFYGFLAGAHSYVTTDDKAYGPIYQGRERVELKGYLTDVLADRAIDFIDRQKAKPFFIYLAFNAVHTPMDAPAELEKKFADVKDPGRRKYLAMTEGLDAAVGRVLAKLKDAGLHDNTLVCFLSDNGGPIAPPGGKFAPNHAKNLPLRGSKGDTWEGGIRVPFLLQWPAQLPAGKSYEQPVIQLDLHATALAAAGVNIQPDWKLDGVDLVPHLKGKKEQPPHEALYWRFGTQMAIRKGNWKLVRADLDLMKPWGNVIKEPMLIDLSKDPNEQQDLAAEQPAKVKELRDVWEAWNKTLPAPAWDHHSLQKGAADDSKLREAVGLYASFDDEVRRDFGQGPVNPGTRSVNPDDKKFIFDKSFDPKFFRIVKDKGVAGGCLQAELPGRSGRLFFPAKGNVAYARDGGWGGAVSVWVNTDPNRDLKTPFCDPALITHKGFNNGSIWMHFNDRQPRDFQAGTYPSIPDKEEPIPEDDPTAPLTRLPKVNFAAGTWHHLVLSWDGFNTGKKTGTHTLYVDGKKIGMLPERAIAMDWDEEQMRIYFAVNLVGQLDELAVFKRPVTEAEVGLLFEKPGVLSALKR